MTRYGSKRLSAEDRILWNRVARTAKPLAGKKPEQASESLFDAELREELKRNATVPPERSGKNVAPASAARRRPAPQHLDRLSRNRLSRGRLPVEARVDLHGLTQAEAHHLLLSFLHQARRDGLRHVLVITGKGASGGSEGALRRAVPQWLATEPFRALVSAFDEAGRRHGGSGALYVRLRRQREAVS